MRAHAYLLLACSFLYSYAASSSLGAYIRAGLGITTTSESVGVASATTAKIRSSRTPQGSKSFTNSSFPQWQSCAESWASYGSMTANLTEVTVVASTYASNSVGTVNLTYGIATVYTTVDGIPRASASTTSRTLHASGAKATPSCSSISPSDCSRQYDSYLASLGLSSDADIPHITPAPANSPACPAYYYQPYYGCTQWRDTKADTNCYIHGNDVQLYYWPPNTANGSAFQTNATLTQSYAPGVTFTSPSIYLSFDYLLAMVMDQPLFYACTSCDSRGCVSTTTNDGQAIWTAGTSTRGALLSLNPADVSTLIVDYPTGAAMSHAKAIAHGRLDPPYDTFGEGANDLKAQRLEVSALVHPALTDYYLNPRGAPGCMFSYPTPECSTVFEGEYRPILSLPAQVTLLEGAWSACSAIFGVYDPPVPLTHPSTVDGPDTNPVIISPSTISGSTWSDEAAPVAGPTMATATTTVSHEATIAVQSSFVASSVLDTSSQSTLQGSTPDTNQHETAISQTDQETRASDPAHESTRGTSADPTSAASDSSAVSSGQGTDALPTTAVLPTQATTNALSVLLSAVTSWQSIASSGDSQQSTVTLQSVGSESAGPGASSESTSDGIIPSTTSDPRSSSVLESVDPSSNGATPPAVVPTTLSDYYLPPTSVSDGIVLTGPTLPPFTPSTTAAGSLLTSISGQASSDAVTSASNASAAPPSIGSPDPDLAYSTASGAIFTAGSRTHTAALDPAAGNVLVVDGSLTLTIGGSAETLDGVEVTATQGSVLVSGSFVPMSTFTTVDPSQGHDVVSGAVVTASSATLTFSIDPAASTLVVLDGSVTLAVGDPPITMIGLTLSATGGGVLVDGSLVSATAMTTLPGVSQSAEDTTASSETTGSSVTTTSYAVTGGSTTSSAERASSSRATAIWLLLGLFHCALLWT